MRKFIVSGIILVMLAGCSTTKYSYYFDYYKTGKKEERPVAPSVPITEIEKVAFEKPNEATLIASAKDEIIIHEPAIPAAATKKTFTKEEKKFIRKELKAAVKEFKRDGVSHVSSGWDHDAKLAAIFGAVGLVFMIIGGTVFSILGAVALLIGLYFLIRWLMEQ